MNAVAVGNGDGVAAGVAVTAGVAVAFKSAVGVEVGAATAVAVRASPGVVGATFGVTVAGTRVICCGDKVDVLKGVTVGSGVGVPLA